MVALPQNQEFSFFSEIILQSHDAVAAFPVLHKDMFYRGFLRVFIVGFKEVAVMKISVCLIHRNLSATTMLYSEILLDVDDTITPKLLLLKFPYALQQHQ